MSIWGGRRLYWANKEVEERERSKGKGIVVMFGFATVTTDEMMNKFAVLYSSLGWSSLICSPPFMNLFFPDKAASMAFLVLKELIKVLQKSPCPVVFASFSGGSKACMYKVIQMLTGTFEAPFNQDDIHLLRNCISGFVYDSSPVDCTSDVVTRFSLNPVIQKAPGAAKVVSWVMKWFSYGSDALFLTKFEAENEVYWNSLHSSINFRTPVLFFCSDQDEFAPCSVICNFAQQLQDIGGDIELLKWQDSPHLGHYEQYGMDYQSAVSSLLEKAASVFSSRLDQWALPRTQRVETDDDIPELICHLQKAALSSKWNLGVGGVGMSSSDTFSKEQLSAADWSSSGDTVNLQDQGREKLVDPLSSSTPSISAHSILGQVLFDACVPKNIEGWDIRFSGSLNGQPFASARRHSPSKSLRCIRRSKL